MAIDLHLQEDPGGKATLLGVSGKDATALFEASHQGPPSTIAEAMPKSMPIIGKYNLDEAQVGPMTLPGTKLGEKC